MKQEGSVEGRPVCVDDHWERSRDVFGLCSFDALDREYWLHSCNEVHLPILYRRV